MCSRRVRSAPNHHAVPWALGITVAPRREHTAIFRCPDGELQKRARHVPVTALAERPDHARETPHVPAIPHWHTRVLPPDDDDYRNATVERQVANMAVHCHTPVRRG